MYHHGWIMNRLSCSELRNWDLVDSSAPHIVGGWLAERSREPLYKLVKSRSLWERRIAILATFYISFACLMHKAIGWMLGEAGKRELAFSPGFWISTRRLCRELCCVMRLRNCFRQEENTTETENWLTLEAACLPINYFMRCPW